MKTATTMCGRNILPTPPNVPRTRILLPDWQKLSHKKSPISKGDGVFCLYLFLKFSLQKYHSCIPPVPVLRAGRIAAVAAVAASAGTLLQITPVYRRMDITKLVIGIGSFQPVVMRRGSSKLSPCHIQPPDVCCALLIIAAALFTFFTWTHIFTHDNTS